MVAGKQTTTAAAWTAANAQRPTVPWLLAQPQTATTASAGALTDAHRLAGIAVEATNAVEPTIAALGMCGSSISGWSSGGSSISGTATTTAMATQNSVARFPRLFTVMCGHARALNTRAILVPFAGEPPCVAPRQDRVVTTFSCLTLNAVRAHVWLRPRRWPCQP